MDALRNTAKHTHFVPIMIFVVVALALLVVVVGKVGNSSTDLRSRASRNTFLTPGDDALSLEQDLNALGQDPTLEDDKALDSLNY